MTTQELKEYIGRVLGNSIRCLLPSYWWKRLFTLVVDKVDEVEGRVLEVPELITSSLAEFAEKYPDIESRTFYLEGSTEKIEKNAALLRKVGEEYQNGIVQHVYLATLFNGETGKLIVTSPQFIVTSDFRFINVATPFFKVLKDVIINEDGTFALEDAKYSVAVDTSKFATTAQLQELDNILSDEIDGLKDSKQNVIEDLAAIRSGAALGATALQEHQDISHLATKSEVEAKYTKPSSGIPKSDLVSEVQESLGKADTAIQNVKTINGESILGEGNIEIKANVDTSNLATKEELESLTNEMIANEEVHAAAYNDLDSRLKDVSSLISGVAVTKEEFQEGIQSVTNEMIANEEVTAAALNELNKRVNAIAENVSGETATKEELAAEVATINNVILENEEVHAAALTDLNSRIEQIITRLNNAGL